MEIIRLCYHLLERIVSDMAGIFVVRKNTVLNGLKTEEEIEKLRVKRNKSRLIDKTVILSTSFIFGVINVTPT